MFLQKVVQALAKAKVKYAVVGGYAVVLHGFVRGTVGIDLVVSLSEKDLLKVEEALKSLGLQSRIPVGASEISQFKDEYIKNKNLIAWSFVNPKNALEVVDIIITTSLEELKTENIRANNINISVCSVVDLIKMKQASGRPQDLEDVKALKQIAKNKG